MPKLETIDSNPLYWNRNPERSYPYPPAMAEVVEERDFDTLRASMARVAKVKKQAMLAYIPRRPRDGAMYGLGQVSANSLDDSQVPYKSMPIYLSRITTMDQLEDYAAGGFHVCVGRGSVGGAKEGSISYGQRLLAGRTFVTPTGALNRPDLVKAWSDAADAYKAAFNMAVVGSFVPAGGIDAVRVQILAANSLAGKAYALEGTIPPKDPGTGSTEVVSMSSSASDLINGAVTGAANAAGTTEKKKGIGMYLAFGAAALLVGFFAFRPESSMAGLGRARYRREEDLSDCGCGG